MLAAHLIENDERGELSFWDKACGVMALARDIEAELGIALSVKQLEAAIKAEGISINAATLTHYVYATERLRCLGEGIPALSGLDVKVIQPRLNALKRYVTAREPIEEAALYATYFEPVFAEAIKRYRADEAFDADGLCQDCEAAIARYLGQSVEDLRAALGTKSRRSRALETLPPDADSPVALTASGPTSTEARERTMPAACSDADPSSLDSRLSVCPPAKARESHASDRTRAIAEHALRVAHLASLDACVTIDETATLGFRVNMAMLGAAALSSGARFALALLSHFALVAESSEALVNESAGSLSWVPDNDLDFTGSAKSPNVTDAMGFVHWLIDPNDALAGECLRLLATLRLYRQRDCSGAKQGGVARLRWEPQ